MKKLLVLVLLISWLFLSGCGFSDTSPADKLKVGLILNFGGPSDNGRNQSADAGLHEVYRDFGNSVETKMFETAADGSNEEYLVRLLAANDYKMVFLFDNDLTEQLPQIAATYPNTRFVRLDSTTTSAIGNLQEATFAIHTAGVAAGALAGFASRTGKIGFIDYNAAAGDSNYEQSFLQGMKLANKNSQLIITTREKLAAPVINPKAENKDFDIIFVNGTWPDQLVIINNCLNSSIKVITCGANPLNRLTSAEEQLLLASVYKDTGRVLYDIVKQQLNGKFTGGVIQYGLTNGMVVGLNEKSNGITAEQKAKYAATLKVLVNNIQGDSGK